MNTHILASIVLSAFVLLAVFGLFLSSGGYRGHEGCPFTSTTAAICVAPLAHLEHWQSSFVAVLVELATLFVAVMVMVVWFDWRILKDPQIERFRLQERIPIRPTLFQELYSQGILNRKEPQMIFRYCLATN